MIRVFLADDDVDDQMFFEEALQEVGHPTELCVMKDGQDLMSTLEEIESAPQLPCVIFLDLNMPRKNGFECLKEIRESPKLKSIPVVIFSTTSNQNAIDSTYFLGANYYICKPNSNTLLKKTLEYFLDLELWKNSKQIQKDKFVLSLI